MVTRIFLCNEQTEPEIRDFIREAIADISEGAIALILSGSVVPIRVISRRGQSFLPIANISLSCDQLGIAN